MDPVNRQANSGRINSSDHTIFVLLCLAQMICKRASLVSYHDMMKSNHQSCCVGMSRYLRKRDGRIERDYL